MANKTIQGFTRDDVTGALVVTGVGGGGGGGAATIIQDEGVALTARPAINFSGPIVQATDDAVNARSNVIIDAGPQIATHEADTTNIHGIADTSQLVLTNDSRLATPRGELKRVAWLPPGVKDENMFPFSIGTASNITSGRLRLNGGLIIPAGDTVNGVSLGAANILEVGGTHAWACLVRVSDLAVLAKSADDTAAVAFTVNTTKFFSFAVADGGTGVYTPVVDEAVYVGIVVVATTMPNFIGTTGVAGSAGLLRTAANRVIAGDSNSALTDPTSLGATANNPGSVNPILYCSYSQLSVIEK